MTRIDLARASDVASGIPSGTSFPVSPTTDDIFYRTDRDLLYFYDGTRWLTITEYHLPLGVSDVLQPQGVTSANIGRVVVPSPHGQLWITKFIAVTYVITTNDGSNFWTVQLASFSGADVKTSVGSSFSTSADAASTWVSHGVTIGASIATTELGLTLGLTRTSGAGAILVPSIVLYRLIG